MEMEVIRPQAVAKPAGDYSHAVRVGNLLFVSGQIPVDREGRIPMRDFRAQAELVFQNIKNVLAEVGATFDNVVKETGYLVNMDMDFQTFIEVRSKYFKGDKHPASTLIEVKSLVPREALLEFEVIAVLD